MKPEEINSLLLSGIRAAEDGELSSARKNLLAVIEVDERSEKAWYWLSRIVDSDEERKICLENVLVINPAHNEARRLLVELDNKKLKSAINQDDVYIRHEVGPISPASALLYPERSTREWSYTEPHLEQKTHDFSYQAHSSYDDVWESEDDICPYCAAELAYDEWRCPNCKRSLKHSYYRYPKPSSDLWIYLVLIIGIGQFSFILVLLGLIFNRSVLDLIWQSLIFVIVIILAAGISTRRFWSYLGSIIALIMIMVSLVVTILIEPETPTVMNELIASEGFFQSLGDNAVLFALEPFVGFIAPIQIVAVILALLYGLLRVGADFERITVRRVAAVDHGISGASMYYARAKQYAEQKMWAIAILHYRRAAALEPTRSFYLAKLGEAYAQLGYYQRSLDVLESARRHETDSQRIEEWTSLIRQVQEQERLASGIVVNGI